MGGSKWSVEGNDRRFRWISRALFSRVIRFETVGRSGFDFPIYFDLIRSSGLRGGDTLHSNLNFKCETRSRDNFCFQCVNLESKNNNNVWKRILYRYVYIYISREVTILLDSEETKSTEDVGGATSKLLISKFRNPINWNLSPCIYICFKRCGQRVVFYRKHFVFRQNNALYISTNKLTALVSFQWMREAFISSKPNPLS